MATLTLKKKQPAAKPSDERSAKPGERRAPLRGKGAAKPRPTLAQAQAERAERQAAWEQRRAEQEASRAEPPARGKPTGRPGAKPAAKSSFKSGERSAAGAGKKPAGSFCREQEPRFDSRGEAPRGDARRANRDDSRPGSRPDSRFDPRQGSRQDARQDTPQEPRRDQRRATGPRAGAAMPPPQPRPPRQAPMRRHDDDGAEADTGQEGERLSKRMAQLGMASRREADEWIAAGWVRVDGKLAVLGLRVGPDAVIQIDPAAHKEQAKQVTILLHKPIGYVSGQAEDGYEPASVLVKSDKHWKDDPSGLKFQPGHARGLAPAGRLDIDSTGLLVLTQDGRIAKLLIGDDSSIEKEYLVRVEYQGEGSPMSRFPAQDLALLNHGLELDGVQLKPAKVSWINEDQLRVVLREGRKRQIRRMCELVGLKVVGLKRVRIGRINLGHLPVGQWRYLAPWERFD